MKILFVCHGNICRSPMAEFILKSMLEKQGLSDKVVVDSAATSTEEIGNSIYPPAQRCLRAHGIMNAKHSARQIRQSDYAYYDLIIGMDEYNIANLKRLFNDKENKIMMLNSKPVSDPWFTDDFETAYREIYNGCEKMIKTIINGPKPQKESVWTTK